MLSTQLDDDDDDDDDVVALYSTQCMTIDNLKNMLTKTNEVTNTSNDRKLGPQLLKMQTSQLLIQIIYL